jgi:hypothetical protein
MLAPWQRVSMPFVIFRPYSTRLTHRIESTLLPREISKPWPRSSPGNLAYFTSPYGGTAQYRSRVVGVGDLATYTMYSAHLTLFPEHKYRGHHHHDGI